MLVVGGRGVVVVLVAGLPRSLIRFLFVGDVVQRVGYVAQLGSGNEQAAAPAVDHRAGLGVGLSAVP
nr:hypothetical protein [Brachybacterium faecium]